MKYIKSFRILAVALALALLVATLPTAPVLAAGYIEVTPNHSIIGERIDVWGDYFAATQQLDIYFSDEDVSLGDRIDTDVRDYEKVVTGRYANDLGALTAYFVVPSKLTDGNNPATKVKAGHYYVYITAYLLKPIIAFAIFTVDSTGEITLDPDEGTVGTEVEITGEGFNEEEEDITVEYDGDDIDIESGDDETDDDGEFTCTIIIPESTADDHTITVIGEDSAIEASAEFTMEPKVTITPESGTTGDTITVSGTGFGDRLDFSIFFDDDEVVEDEETNRKGSFEVTFAVPPLAQGSYDIEAEDEDNNSDKVEFTITASTISLNPTSGKAGDEVTLSGTGFPASKPITITFDNTIMDTVASDEQGKFKATFTVPVRTKGTYAVKADDGTNILTDGFSIGTDATISPKTGHVGTEITVSGVGFVAGKTATITYDGDQVVTTPQPVTVNPDGNFSATFNVPASTSGEHIIKATGLTAPVQSTFVMESTPPPIPAPLKPEMGIKAEAGAYFGWEEVTDDSLPVTYTLQIATENFTSESFSQASMVLERTGITTSEYTLTKEDRLESVSKDAPYYWRVKAVDGASNGSEWSLPGTFHVGFSFGLSQGVIYTLIGIGALILFIFGFLLGRRTAYF